jgi:hypothetical protein
LIILQLKSAKASTVTPTAKSAVGVTSIEKAGPIA